jgi:predicted DNA-binding transcriptional regulator AlpA
MNELQNPARSGAIRQLFAVPGDNYLTTVDVCERYDINRDTLNEWRKTRAFPEPVRLSRSKNHYSFPEIKAWEARQAGRDINAEFALGCKIVSTVIQSYEDFVAAMKDRKVSLGLTNEELEARAGMTEGYIAKLESYSKGKKNSRGMGPDTFPLWLGGNRVGIILVDLPRRPKKGRGPI